ncbi:coiled-coil domain-containing protein 146 [Pelodytes ibericus]
MSSIGEGRRLSSDSSEDEKDVIETPLNALAPFSIQEESPKDVLSSPAFQCLDELFTSGKIPGTRAAELKAKYTLLYDSLKSSQESEIQLLQDAKRFTNQLEQQQQELEKVDQFPDGSNTEVSRMREQLLKYINDLNETEDREHHLQYKLKCLQEEKQLLEREYERIPKGGELENRAKMLKESIEELQKENAQRKLEIKAPKEDVESKQMAAQKEQKELEKKLEEQEVLKENLVKIQHIPARIGKQTEKIIHKITEVKNKIRVEEQCQDLNDSMKRIEHRTKMALEEKNKVMKELEGNRTMLENKEKEFNHLKKLLEISEENKIVALEERATLDLKLCDILVEKQTLHDALTRNCKEKEIDLRNVKKMELQLKLTNDASAQAQVMQDKVKAEMDNLARDGGTPSERRRELRKEVEMIKWKFVQQQKLTEVEAHNLKQIIAEEDKFEKERCECREEVVNLKRLLQIKADERNQKLRELMNVQQRHQQFLQEIKQRDLILGEHKKRYQNIQKRIQEFGKMHDVMLNDRNKCLSLLEMSSQEASEMTEKLQFLGNEVEILRTIATNKERFLQRAKVKLSNNHMMMDNLRKDVSRASKNLQEMEEKKEQQKMKIGRVTNIINQTGEDMVQLHKKYESAVQNRNERGVQLIEREEEVCIFHEKINTQEMLLRNQDVELMALEEKIRFRKMQITEKKRQITQDKKLLGHKKALDSDCVTFQIQLLQCNDRKYELQRQIENPGMENRTRLLKGNVPSLQKLMKKTEELDLHLAKKEQRLLEKDFLYKEASRLTEQLQAKVENDKQNTLMLAKKMNELKRQIKDKTHKVMSVIAELSMQQANCIKLQQEARAKEKLIETCYTRMEQGLPPSEEIEQEWKRMVRDARRRHLNKEEKARKKEEEEHYRTAEQRPNAYIPDDDENLPLPRPYGNLAPFKPSELGSNMRHIKKPQKK